MIVTDDNPSAYCGATLINNRYILTAAHCIPDMMDTGIENFRIYLGTNYINSSGTDFLDLGIDTIISHPKFDFDTAEHDICLIKLSESVVFTSYINPICLRQTGCPFVDRRGYITGWGSFNLTEHTEDALKESEVVVVSNEICAKNYSSEDIPVTDNMLCAALPGEDPCKGDSGGPLIVKGSNNEDYTQIGIISHGEGCAVQDFPAIFTRVSSYINWIKDNTKDVFRSK
ncbi:Plasma kallikrein, partial [Orchesella cincta]